VAQLG